MRDTGTTEQMCEVRVPAQFTDSWGEPMAAMHVVVLMHGAAQVTATELLHNEANVHAAVELQATWDVHIPPHLHGIVQLHTAAEVNSHSALLRIASISHACSTM